jgi:methionyl-tRNA synthetase
MILADILKRWSSLKGRPSILCTGTDEHGMKIQRASSAAGIPPKEFCDKTSQTFKALASRANLANDHFVRTTDPDHKEAVQYFWHLLQEKGWIYESKHEGWYSVSDETYYPEAVIEKRLDPFTGRILMASKETGSEVEWSSERNHHFRLSAFKEPLLKFYKENPKFITPVTRMKDVVRQVGEGLEDLSISRPIERLTWGIPVPNDETQTIYVWLDALINYITKAGYPWAPGSSTALGWPADVQVIGKDIVRFHCIYWPAFLLALNLSPPKQILTHAHWTLNHRKMAKSTGNVVNPFFAMDRFGVDVMRFYLAHEGGIKEDSDYGNDYIVKIYKNSLQGGLGNLVSRVTRPKAWSVSECVRKMHEGIEPEIEVDELTRRQIEVVEGVRDLADGKMGELDSGAALRAIMEVVYEVRFRHVLRSLVTSSSSEVADTFLQTNKYLQLTAPWTLSKSNSPIDLTPPDQSTPQTYDLNQLKITQIIYYSSEAIRICGILLQPFMPTKANQLLDMLGVDEGKRRFQDAVLGGDGTYGEKKVPVGKCAHDSLFPPLLVEN